MRERSTLRIGTRGSALALAQARLAAGRLETAGWRIEIVPIRTGGDRAQTDPSMMLSRGAFVAELEHALREAVVDVAVHSVKDMPAEDPDDLALVAYLPRGDARDAVVSGSGSGLAALPRGARVGTESPRRRAFLLRDRPDLEIVAIRGNIDTRLAKLDRGEVDALVLAAIGLERLDLAGRISERLAPERMLPAVGQGALAVQVRAADSRAPELAGLDDPATRQAITAERSFLRAMGGGCRAPYAAHAVSDGGKLILEGAALEPDGLEIVRDRLVGAASEGERLGARLAATLLGRGAGALAPRAG